MLFGKCDLEEKPLLWECKFCAVDLGIRFLYQQTLFLGLDVSVSPGNAIAHYPGKRGKKLLAFRTF